MDYKRKLEQFNGTEKYEEEMAFMHKLIGPISEEDFIFDMGAGIGTLIEYLSNYSTGIVLGYDKEIYGERRPWYRDEIPEEAECLLMMHSVAHIDNVEEVLSGFDGSVCVITPNKDYLQQVGDEGYIPDPTVLQHYNLPKLTSLFTSCGYKVVISGQFGEYLNGFNERIFLKAEKL